MEVTIMSWCVRLQIISDGPLVTYGALTLPRWSRFDMHWSRTIEWQDAEWANVDKPWPEFYQENAL